MRKVYIKLFNILLPHVQRVLHVEVQSETKYESGNRYWETNTNSKT